MKEASPVPPTTVTAETLYSYQATVKDAKGTVTFTLLTAPTGMTVSTAGLVTRMPGLSDVASHPVSPQDERRFKIHDAELDSGTPSSPPPYPPSPPPSRLRPTPWLFVVIEAA